MPPGIERQSSDTGGSWTGRTPCSRSSAAGSAARRAPCTSSGTAWTSRSAAFSGRPGAPIEADAVTQEAYSQEVISFGFWAGDDRVGMPPTTRTRPRNPRDCVISCCRRASGSSSAPARWRSSLTRRCAPRTPPKRCCSPSARVPTRRVLASPAGIPPASSRNGAPAPAQLQQLHATGKAIFGRTDEKEGRRDVQIYLDDQQVQARIEEASRRSAACGATKARPPTPTATNGLPRTRSDSRRFG